jgi:hypothetical protein
MFLPDDLLTIKFYAMTAVSHPPAFLLRRKFLLFLPLIAFPFLAFVFYSLGGGQGPKKNPAPASTVLGFNMELPKAKFNRRDSGLNKLGYYQKADADSLRKKEFGQRDPYMQHPLTSDRKADELLHQLDIIRKTVRQPVEPGVSVRPPQDSHYDRPAELPRGLRVVSAGLAGSAGGPLVSPPATSDPQIERLNLMLDKILRIQHPDEHAEGSHQGTAMPGGGAAGLAGGFAVGSSAGELLAADSSNALPAVVPDNQVLVSGSTIALRLLGDATLNGMRIPKDQLVYGIVSINNDRMQVTINSIRRDHDIYGIAVQVYDMDGLPGIHIPGMVSREVAKQSADQGVSGLNLVSLDPSLGAQAANAGIQTAKSLFSRKVRLVRVSVRAGYQVLLRNTRSTHIFRAPFTDTSCLSSIQPPGIVPGGSFLCRCRSEGMELDCRGLFLKDDLLWFALDLQNHGSIGYFPEYVRWVIRDRKQFKRTAIQDLALSPVYAPFLTTVAGDSMGESWTGFRPFALGKDKELVVEMGERGGGRVLTLVITHSEILHAKHYEKESGGHTK